MTTGTQRGRRRWEGVLAAAVLVSLAGCSGGAARSTSAASAGAGNQGEGTGGQITVPIKVTRHHRAILAVVPVRITGHGPYQFLLDTGSSVSSISSTLVHTLHLSGTGTTQTVRGVTGTSKIPLVHVAHWKLGTAGLAPEDVASIDLSATHGGGLDGLLGSDQLSNFGSVTVDYAHGTLRLAHLQH